MDPMDYLCISFFSFAGIEKNLFGSSTALVASPASGTSDALRKKKKRYKELCRFAITSKHVTRGTRAAVQRLPQLPNVPVRADTGLRGTIRQTSLTSFLPSRRPRGFAGMDLSISS